MRSLEDKIPLNQYEAGLLLRLGRDKLAGSQFLLDTARIYKRNGILHVELSLPLLGRLGFKWDKAEETWHDYVVNEEERKRSSD